MIILLEKFHNFYGNKIEGAIKTIFMAARQPLIYIVVFKPIASAAYLSIKCSKEDTTWNDRLIGISSQFREQMSAFFFQSSEELSNLSTEKTLSGLLNTSKVAMPTLRNENRLGCQASSVQNPRTELLKANCTHQPILVRSPEFFVVEEKNRVCM